MRNDYNEDFFSDTESLEVAYWVGFLSGDGYVSQKNGNNTIAVNLKIDDKDHLQKLANYLGCNRLYYYDGYDKRTKKTYQKCTLRAANKKLVYDLINLWGMEIEDKTVNLGPPPKGFEKGIYIAWLHGMYDADGSYDVKKNRPRMYLTSTESVVLWADKILSELLDIKSSIRKDKRYENIYYLWHHGDSAIKVRKLFHELEIDSLERKKTLWEDRGANMKILSEYEHGTTRMYGTKKCRCELCRAAALKQERERKRKG